MASAKSKVSMPAPNPDHLSLKPIINDNANKVSRIVAATARKGIIPAGAKEFTSAVYCKKAFHPEDWLPQKWSLEATAERKVAANDNLNSSTAVLEGCCMSWNFAW